MDKSSEKKITTAFRLRADLRDRLQREGERLGYTQTLLLETTLDDYLERTIKKLEAERRKALKTPSFDFGAVAA